jgi:protein-disulfide isomerase
LHSKAPKEAEALECAGELGGNDGFWKFLDRLNEVTPGNDGLDPAQLPIIAKFVGINVDKFNTCYSSGKFAAKVQQQYDDAVKSGGRGTPYSVLVGKGQQIPLSGALPQDQLQAAIDSLLK